MTRFASIMGVAAVATLVLLSGCEQAMEKTDYVKDLEGTWEVMELATSVDVGGTAVPGTADIEVSITSGDKLNTGDFTLEVNNTTPIVGLVTATGSIEADSDEIKVTIDSISPADFLPPQVQALQGEEVTINYTVTDDSLEISSALLLSGLGVVDEKLRLTKQ